MPVSPAAQHTMFCNSWPCLHDQMQESIIIYEAVRLQLAAAGV
jgi:hypothetical protein